MSLIVHLHSSPDALNQVAPGVKMVTVPPRHGSAVHDRIQDEYVEGSAANTCGPRAQLTSQIPRNPTQERCG